MNSLRKRTVISFSLFFMFILFCFSAFYFVSTRPITDEIPSPLRQVLEWNGNIWHSFYSPNRRSDSGKPIRGKLPRVNGDIGLDKAIDLNAWTLEVIEDDHDPKSQHLTLNLDAIKALPHTDSNTQFRCIEGWSENMSFGGVKFSDFMKAYKIKMHRFVGLETTDGEYYVSIDMESMLHDQTLLAYEMNGAALRLENGAPLRLAIPIKYGIKNLKQIGKIFLSDIRPRDYWAEQGYDWFSGL